MNESVIPFTSSKLQLIFDQNKLLDLKYTMQQLLARMLHKSNPKAAAKAVDKMIEDVETCVPC